MGELARSENTPATDAAFDTLARIAVDEESTERYPSDTVLIPADAPDVSILISRAIAEERPITLVFPDGSDIVARPPETKGFVLLAIVVALIRLLERTSKKRDRPTFVPREWVTEFHEAPAGREPEPVA